MSGLLLFATFIYRSDATVGITVVSGATTVLALTATQVTNKMIYVERQ